jgi:hypothetical protein
MGLAYGGTSGSVTMFGGYNPFTTTIYGDTWNYNANTNVWTQASTSGPNARMLAGFTYDDGSTGNVLGDYLVGGLDPTTLPASVYSDQWVWS